MPKHVPDSSSKDNDASQHHMLRVNDCLCAADPLVAIERVVQEEQFLRLSVLDIQLYDDTLVVLVDQQVPRAFLAQILRRSWSGPVEVYCASALMAGSDTALM
ncbi:MAG: hypothetical protein AAGF28_02460 [Pseudomonadota bacterium]